jgi:hypothetical protein
MVQSFKGSYFYMFTLIGVIFYRILPEYWNLIALSWVCISIIWRNDIYGLKDTLLTREYEGG